MKGRFRKILLVLVVIAALGLVVFVVLQKRAEAPSQQSASQSPGANPAPTPAPQPGTAFDKSQFSLDEPGSLWQIVNKKRPLPDDYAPDDLVVPNVRLRLNSSEQQMQFRKVATEDLAEMFAAAEKDGIKLVFGSGYRSYKLQKQFYDSYVAKDGKAAADRYSARPGTSEHQTGLSFDVTTTSGTCHLEVCFAFLEEGEWVADHAHEYGFIIRYPKDGEAVTGYQYEPWHLRYVGKPLAQEVTSLGLTLEEYFEL